MITNKKANYALLLLLTACSYMYSADKIKQKASVSWYTPLTNAIKKLCADPEPTLEFGQKDAIGNREFLQYGDVNNLQDFKIINNPKFTGPQRYVTEYYRDLEEHTIRRESSQQQQAGINKA